MELVEGKNVLVSVTRLTQCTFVQLPKKEV